jgi:Tol biopolymer transport system component
LCDAKTADSKSIPFVASADGKTWNISYEKFDGNLVFYGDNHVLLWTPDDHFLYVAPYVPPVSYGGRQFYAALDVWRLDLTSGFVKSLFIRGQMPYESYFYDLSVSPDGKRLAYVNQWQIPLMLDLLSLSNGQQTELKIADTNLDQRKFGTAGELVWSQDGQRLAYKLITSDSTDPCSYDYSILLLNLSGMTTQTLISGKHIPLCVGAYLEYHVTQVGAQQVTLNLNGTTWVYDLAAKGLTQLTTETPTP